MIKKYNLFWVLPLVFLAASSCYRAPEFPIEPTISFNSIKFYDVVKQPNSDPRLGPPKDSLVITINFQDGDGDLGVEGNENDPPFHSYFFVTVDNRKVEYPGNNTLLKYDPENPTLPPLTCENHVIGRVKDGRFISAQSKDYPIHFPDPQDPNKALPPETFYIENNIFANNFLVDFLVKRDGRYEEFDFNEATVTGCGERFDSKFPIIFDPNAPGKPLSGELTNRMESAGFINYFRNDTLKLRIQIIDRALHMSNIIETPAFYFVNKDGIYKMELLEE